MDLNGHGLVNLSDTKSNDFHHIHLTKKSPEIIILTSRLASRFL